MSRAQPLRLPLHDRRSHRAYITLRPHHMAPIREAPKMMTVDDVGFDPQREELLMLDDEADPGLSAAALRAEIDSW